MKRRRGATAAFLLFLLGTLAPAAEPARPLALHPDNGHYFLFRGRPTVIVTSAEHYGAVLNLDFDYVKYLDELAAHSLNCTRTFAGAYCEDDKSFNIARNTLAPAAGRLICPWSRSQTPGYAGGGNKFDLDRWDEAYFRRLKDFLAQAGRRGVIVELNLFCPFYEEPQWKLSPMNAANNVNQVGAVARDKVYTLDQNGGLLKYQEAMVRKLVAETADFDNLYFEVCNEPYFGGVTMPWQHRIVDVIAQAQRDRPGQHLVSLNVANGKAKIERPHPGVSIFNFHYASPPDTVGMNFALGKVIGDNETGFKGTADSPYRREAWEFLLAGGGLFNHLDYSFAVGHEDGTYVYPDKQPGGGSRGFRRQMKVLKEFIESFDFVRMKPEPGAVVVEPKEAHALALVERDRQYAVYVRGGKRATVTIPLPAGKYTAQWINTRTGAIEKQTSFQDPMVPAKLESPPYDEDIALRLRAQP